MKKIRILIVNGGLMDRGGISMFIINYLKHFDFNRFEIDIAVHGENRGSTDSELEKLGCKIINLPIKSKSFFKWNKELRSLLKNGNYNIIHSNADAGNGPILKIAKKSGILIRISHSHNTQFLTNNKIKLILNKIQKQQILKYATHFYACSQMAGDWLYDGEDFTIINNAVDYTNFTYNDKRRETIRKHLNVSNDKFIVGHVGRFDYQKNHKFIIEIAEALKNNNKIIFLLIGDGHLKNDITKEIKYKDLRNIIMTGEIDNVSEYLNAMDCLILPSLFEGLSVVSIEAQVNGLPCIFSSAITKECEISNNVTFLSIESPIDWKNELLSISNVKEFNRQVDLKDKFNLEVQSDLLQKKYIQYVKETYYES